MLSDDVVVVLIADGRTSMPSGYRDYNAQWKCNDWCIIGCVLTGADSKGRTKSDGNGVLQPPCVNA